MDRYDRERRRAKIGAALAAATLIVLAVAQSARGADAPPPDAARVATLMSWYDDVGLPVACGRAAMPKGARVVATHPRLGIPCGARVSIELSDGRRFVFVRVDSGPFVAGRSVDASKPAIRRMGLDPEQGVYPVRVVWRRDLPVCLPPRWLAYSTPLCGAPR